MSVRLAVLGLLIEEPRNRYDVKMQLRQRVGIGDRSPAVYAAFDALEAEGLIRETKPSSKWFEATKAGVDFFEGWMLEGVGPEAPPLRSELLMKLGFRIVSDEVLVQLYRGAGSQAEWCVERMNELASGGDLAALAERDKDLPVVSPILLRDAESVFLEAAHTYLGMVRRELRRVYELRTGRRLEA